MNPLNSLFIWSVGFSLAITCGYIALKLARVDTAKNSGCRIWIMLLLLSSVVVPLVPAQIFTQDINIPVYRIYLDEIIVETASESGQTVSTGGISVIGMMAAIYLCGMVVMTARFVMSILSLMRLKRDSVKEEVRGRISIFRYNSQRIAPCSFGNWIFLPETLPTEKKEMVVAHECAHLSSLHWVDLMVIELAAIVDWYNPFIRSLRLMLTDQHEFEADSIVLNNGFDSVDYQLTLIRLSSNEGTDVFANHLYHNSLKKRITMMQKTDSKSSVKWMKGAVIIPAAAGALLLTGMFTTASATAGNFGDETPPNPALNDGILKIRQIVDDVTSYERGTLIAVTDSDDGAALMAEASKDTDDKVYNAVEIMPSFPGGEAGMMNYLVRNMKYPEEAVKNNIQGRVIVQFIVRKDGAVDGVKVMRSVDPLLDAEAVRVVETMKGFKPGMTGGKPVNVYYTLPVNFRLSSSDKDKTGE